MGRHPPTYPEIRSPIAGLVGPELVEVAAVVPRQADFGVWGLGLRVESLQGL